MNVSEEANHKQTPHTCDVCNSAFSGSGSLIKHKRTHTGEKPYICDVCGAAFAQSGDLAAHKRTHTGEKPYVCDVCNAAFSQSGHLVSHKRTHTGEKPYVCDVCNAAFSQSGHLIKHKRTHTGEKPYVCDVCNAAFSESGHLISHKRTHTGEKPYVCDVCNAAFSQSGDLIKHKRTYTGEKPYICDVCGAAFAQSGHLAAHKSVWHSARGIMRKKRREEKTARFLESVGYVFLNSDHGDAEPTEMGFIREKSINFRCADAWSGRTLARIDFVLRSRGTPVLTFIEVDEDQHRYGNAKRNASGYSCDAKRIQAIMASVALEAGDGARKISVIRFNPDSFSIGDQKVKDIRIADKLNTLGNEIVSAAAELEASDAAYSITYIDYDLNDNYELSIFDDPEYPDDMRIVARVATTTPRPPPPNK